jgi:hypothetical protein
VPQPTALRHVPFPRGTEFEFLPENLYTQIIQEKAYLNPNYNLPLSAPIDQTR